MYARLQPANSMPSPEPLPQPNFVNVCNAGDPLSLDFASHFARFSIDGSQCLSLFTTHQIRRALLLFFADPIPRECLRLWLLSSREWRLAVRWLDISGLALYFLARVQDKCLEGMLPRPVLRRLRQNLADNTRRTASMLAESTDIQREFQHAGLHYAVLKGFSLWPHSVPQMELRSQLDLDFLIAEHDAPAARRLLEDRGYRLRAKSGRTWEFRTDAPPSSLAELYCATPNRSLELHLESPNSRSSILTRLDHVRRHGVSMPVLPPPDLFIGQGLHLYKHVCSEFYRPAHMLEFRRHVLARFSDSGFWEEVRDRGERSRRTSLALGVITLLIERTMGPFAPEAFSNWTVAQVPRTLRAWVERYGVRSAVMGSPGNKLYLLLQHEMEALGIGSRRTIRQALVPRSLPPAISHAAPNATLGVRAHCHILQCRFILQRLRFHVLAGFGYLREIRAWKRIVSAQALSPRGTMQ